MTNIEKLIAISSEPLARRPDVMPEFLSTYALGPELFSMLQQKNGFYAFESALHILPLTPDPASGLAAWNADALWRREYQDLAANLLFFGQDILQDQFCISRKKGGVFRFYAETGLTDSMADSIETWAERILANDRIETGWPLAHEWNTKNGTLPRGKRLMPKTPFFMGGEYTLNNLWAGNPLEGMRLKGDLAIQTRDMQSGTKIKLKVAPKPE